MPFTATHELTIIALTSHICKSVEINHLAGTAIVPAATGNNTVKNFTDDAIVDPWVYNSAGLTQSATATYNSTWANLNGVLPKIYKWYAVNRMTCHMKVWNKTNAPFWATLMVTDDPDVCASNANMWAATNLKTIHHQRWKKRVLIMANTQLTNKVQTISMSIPMKALIQNPIVKADDYTWAFLTAPSTYGVPTRALNLIIAFTKPDGIDWAVTTPVAELQVKFNMNVTMMVPHANSEMSLL